MSKKILSVMLALVMVLSVFSVSAFAAVNVEYETYDEDAGETEIAYTQYWSLATDNVANENGEYTVNVSLQTNYAVGVMSFVLATEGATLKTAVAGEAITDGYNADVKASDDGTTVYIIPDPASEGESGLNLENGGIVATLTFTLNEGASNATVALVNDAKTVDNDGKLIAVRLSNGTLASNTMYYGQRVIDVDGNDIDLDAEIASVTLGEEAADPELIAKEGTTGYVDADRMYVYGVDIGADPLNYFEATNNGYIEMTANSEDATNGTGATLTLYKDNTKAEVIATYTLVIFGDVNGDGVPAPADALAIYNHSTTLVTLTGAQFFAADITADGAVAPADALAIYNHATTVQYIAANVWA